MTDSIEIDPAKLVASEMEKEPTPELSKRSKAIMLALSAINLLGFAFYIVYTNGGLNAIFSNLVNVWYGSLIVSAIILVCLGFLLFDMATYDVSEVHLTRRLKYLGYFAIGDLLTIIPALAIIYGLVSFVMAGWYISLFASICVWVGYAIDWLYQGMDEFR